MSKRSTAKIICSLLEEETDEISDDAEDFKGLEMYPKRQGFFTYFSRPVVFSVNGTVKPVMRLGPYKGFYTANKKGQVGISGEEPPVTFTVKKETYTPFFPMYDGKNDMELEFLDPDEALDLAKHLREPGNEYGVVAADGTIVIRRK